MQDAKNLKEYRKEMQESLDNNFLRKALDTFAVTYRASRTRAFAEFDVDRLVADVAEAKDSVLPRLDELFAEFRKMPRRPGCRSTLPRMPMKPIPSLLRSPS
jgi:L-lactate utilization protein LutB